MARTQAKILTTIWSDPDWLKLTGNAQRVYLLLLSQPKLTIAGCLDVMPQRWANLAADDTPESIAAALNELARALYIVIDGDELVIRTFVAHDLGTGTVNNNLVKGMWSAWASIMSPILRKVVVDEMPAKVFDREGIDVPDQAKQLRSEPRFEPQFQPWFEPQSEPSVDLKSVDLLPADCSPIKSQDYTGSEPAEPSHDDEPAAAPDEQAIRKTAALVGRAVASAQAGIGNPGAYAAGVTRQILDPTGDGIDRERIVRLLTSGETPEGIASGWAVDPFGFPADSEPAPAGPDLAAFYAGRETRRREQMADQVPVDRETALVGLKAARAAMGGAA